MPETSVVVKIAADDKYSDAIKTIQSATKAFSKDVEGLQAKLDALNKNKAVLKVDTDRAKKALREAEKQIGSTSDAVGRMVLEEKQLTFENARRNLELLSKAAKDTEKQINKTIDASSRSENRAGGGSIAAIASDAMKTIGIANLMKMFSQPAQDFANYANGSTYGADTGTMAASVLSSVLSGASIGLATGGPAGAAAGAAVGALAGGLSGLAGIEGNKDEAYKTWYKGLYEDAGGITDASLAAGGSLASARERDRVSFATLFGDEEIGRASCRERV